MSISVQTNTARILTLSNANGASNAQDSSAADADGATQGGAAFGAVSVDRQLNAHLNLVSILNDTLQQQGVGQLVDADLDTETAKLQALQVQQQLSGQPFSVANQAPGAILQLFRS